MKVLQVVHDLRLGGAERIAVTLCQGLTARGAQVTLLAIKETGPQEKDLPSGKNFQMEILGVKRRPMWLLPLFIWDAARLLYLATRALKRYRPDAIQTHIPEDDLVFGLAIALTGIGQHIPLVHSMHFYPDREGRGLRNFLRTKAYKWMASRAAKVCTVSKPVAERFCEQVGIPQNRIEVLPTGVNLTRFQNRPSSTEARKALAIGQDKKVILALGRVVRAKNYPRLVRASRKVLQKFPDALFLLIGDGNQMSAVKKEIAHCEVGDSWMLLGARANVPEILPAADIFVQSSDWEGLPVAVLEAMACGIPVVATDAGGTTEIIQEGKTGKLVPTGGGHEALSLALTELLEQPDTAKRLGQIGCELVHSKYNQETFLDREMALLKTCTGHSP